MAKIQSEHVKFQGGEVILRKYNNQSDPERLVIHLFDNMNSPDGLAELIASDKRFVERGDSNIRFVAEFRGELIATLTLVSEYWNNQAYHMYSVVTAREFRGSGITQHLFEYACRWVRTQEKKLIAVDTYGDNLRAQHYFEKVGFTKFGEIPLSHTTATGEKINQLFYYLRIPNKKRKRD